MGDVLLKAEPRTIGLHSSVTALRNEKKIPAVVYGDDKKNEHVTVDKKEFQKIIRSASGLNTIISLTIDNNVSKVLVHEIQRDIITKDVIHVDFYRIRLTEKIKVKVPIHLTGRAVGQEMGGVVDHIIREIEVECLPTNIPPKFEIDISALNIGDSKTVSDLVVPKEVTILADARSLVVHVVSADKEEPKPEAVAVEGALEPEVIAKGKEKAEGEEGAAEGEEKEKQPPAKDVKETKEKK